ncbi:threonine dehydratase [uncultured Jatrophihabitans sp.]|uniref:threonine dehydratase n=1 Tax=uncultured Jatrophihabitans sp. TaxID=1610747 RepID=UPI0035C98ABD
MSTPLFTLAELDAAADLVHRSVSPTPSYEWPLLSAALSADVVVKHENHTPVGAFKMRGGLVYVDHLRRERPEVTRIVSATRGNHGQSLAFAGRAADLAVTIVVPRGNSADKNAAMRALGADVVEHGDDFQAAREHAAHLAEADPGVELVPSFHRELVLGVATYAYELFAQVRDLEAVYVPVGMGSGICALMAVRDLLGLPTEVVGVVSRRADATARSFEAGQVVPTESADTFVDGVATRVPDAEAIARIVAGAARIVRVGEDDAAEAMRLVFRTTHNVAEPAGSLAAAGLAADADRIRGRRVAMVLSGGNVDAPVLAAVLGGDTPRS